MTGKSLLSSARQLTRRHFCRNGTLLLLPLGRLAAQKDLGSSPEPITRIGLVTDLHHADKAPAGTRHYRETLSKLEEAGQRFREVRTSHVIELGDLIDAADSVELELKYLKTINRLLGSFPGENHYVLGNHCVDTLTKNEFLSGVGKTASYYSFDESGFHIVILDACFRSDGVAYQRRNFEWTDPNLSNEEMHWLEQDLGKTDLPVVVFVHQRLDVGEPYGIKNASRIRKILEENGQVRGIFQGHSHKNDHRVINGIHYVTLVAMVEGSGAANSGYSLLGLHASGMLSVEGFRRQDGYRMGQ